jgi:hypothetical protein
MATAGEWPTVYAERMSMKFATWWATASNSSADTFDADRLSGQNRVPRRGDLQSVDNSSESATSSARGPDPARRRITSTAAGMPLSRWNTSMSCASRNDAHTGHNGPRLQQK